MYSTSESQRKASAKYRENHRDKYAEYKRNFYNNNADYVEREKKRLKDRYAIQKEFKAFLNILLE